MLLFDKKELGTPLEVLKIKNKDNEGVHNFSYYSFHCYFRLYELISKRLIRFLSDDILQIDPYKGSPAKIMVYGNPDELEILSVLQKTHTIYSIHKLPLPKESKYIEIGYSLPSVFSKNTYSNAKKRHKILTYPFSFEKKYNLSIKEITSFTDDIFYLHENWCKSKLENPKVFKITFSSSRYLYTIKEALKNLQDYKVFAAYMENKLIAIRVIGVQGSISYDMAFFGNNWDTPSNIMNQIDVLILYILYNKYKIIQHNCGNILNKNLGTFKKHIPFYENVSYKYGIL